MNPWQVSRRIEALMLITAALAASPALAVDDTAIRVAIPIVAPARPVRPMSLPMSLPPISHPEVWSVRGPALGVQLVEITPELRRHFGAAPSAGVLVARVLEGTAAVAAGVEVGDVLVAVDDHPVGSAGEVRARLRSHGAGTTVALAVIRGGERQVLTATLQDSDRAQVDFGPLLTLSPGQDRTVYRIDPDTFGEAQRRLGEILTEGEWHKYLERMRGTDAEVTERMEQLERRLHELEQQLRE